MPASSGGTPPCPVLLGGCLEVDATSTGPPLTHVASGFLHGTDVANTALVGPLAPASWRLNVLVGPNGPDTTDFDAARRLGAKTITVLVSDAWYWASSDGCGLPSPVCGARPPWDDLAAYGGWLTSYVRQVEATGRRPDYWEVQNEPDQATMPGAYYDAADAARVTPTEELAQFDTAYHAIKAADPTAKVVGPSLGTFRSAPFGRELDMATFLAFSAANGLRWDAISWHELSSSGDPTPGEGIAADVSTVRRLLANYPTLGSPAIAVTEYGSVYSRLLPGWIVGDMAALESAGVAFASRMCAPTATDPGGGSECDGPPGTLDGLLLGTGQPTAAYWAYAAYAALHGVQLDTFSPSPTISILGVRDPAGAVHLLIGRHVTCTRVVNADCPFPTPSPPPVAIPLAMTLPWSGPTHVTVRRIPNRRGVVAGLDMLATTRVTVIDGVLSLVLPPLGDGEALVVDVQPVG